MPDFQTAIGELKAVRDRVNHTIEFMERKLKEKDELVELRLIGKGKFFSTTGDAVYMVIDGDRLCISGIHTVTSCGTYVRYEPHKKVFPASKQDFVKALIS